MRTRSQTHRPQQQVPPNIEPFNLEEPLENQALPVVTMADQRTMAQLLQAPTEGNEDEIVLPAITADNFELKHGLLTLVQNKPFFGLDKEDPHAHIRYFNKITSTLKFPNVSNTHGTDSRISFVHAHIMVSRNYTNSILSTMTFAYSNDQDSLNSAAGGNFLDKMPRDCLAIIESKSKVRYSRDKAIVAKVGTSSSTPGVSPDVAELKDMVRALLLDKKNQSQAPATVKAVEESCVTCGGAHSYLGDALCRKERVKSRRVRGMILAAQSQAFNQENSIDQGPFELGTTRDTLRTTPEGGVLLGPERPHTYEDLSDTEKKRYNADVRATNIVLQGLAKDIYKLINHNIEAKAIWDNVKMIFAGSELTKEDRESQLYDEFERFKMLPGENINEYYVRFHKLVNDMRNITMTMPNIQLNSKFVNNMSPEWDRFMTAVKLNKGLKETNHEQLYAYLKQHEKHAAQDRLIIERITPATNDQHAFVQWGGAQNRAGNANVGQGKPVKCYDCNGVGHIARNYTQPKRPQNSNYFKDKMLLMQAQENGAVLDEKELLFLAGEQGNTFDVDVDNQPVQDLALNKDNIFQADECNAFDSDVDDEPTAQTIFMANMSSAGLANPQAGPSNASILSESNVIDSISVDMGNSNVIPYEQYLSVDNMSVVPSCVSSALNDVCVSFDNYAFVPHDPIATELKTYKEQVAIYEQRAKFELTEREQRMDDQMCMLIQNHNKTEENLKKELHSVKLQLNSTMKNNKIFEETVMTLKHEFKQKESKFLTEFFNLKHLNDKLENKLHSQDQSIQTVHIMLNLAQVYDQRTKIVLGAQNPFHLRQAKKAQPALFLYVKMNDSACVEKRVNITPPNYLKENFMPTFTPQTQLTPEQNETDLKSGEIERKNLLIKNENLLAECLSKDVFYTATNSVLNVSRFSDMHDAFTIAQKRVKGASAASRSNPRSNTKKDRTLPANSALKQVEAHSRMNKSNEKQKNRVDSSISYKSTALKSDCMPADPQETIAPVVQIVLWYLDSGCSKHMTGDRSRLRNFVKKFIGTVRFRNDHFGAIMGYRDYVIGDSVISRVYYVEGLGHNLFFVGQFCDSDLEVAFRKHTCFVRDLDGVDLIKGSRGTNLYTISVEDMISTLNDLARKDLVRGLPRLKFEKDHLCSACQLGKSRKATHKPKTINTITEVLHTLHMDLCEPLRVQSINGKKYILLRIDKRATPIGNESRWSLRLGTKVLAKVGKVTYRLDIPQKLSRVHHTFHVSNLKKCYADEPLVMPLEGIHVDDKLQFVEEPVEIMEREIKRLKRIWIPLVKVRWNSRRGPEFTWECEDLFEKKYPHFFTNRASSSTTRS
ncbi:hypothetical protein Tco_1465847 [Tanacetum coccineum]